MKKGESIVYKMLHTTLQCRGRERERERERDTRVLQPPYARCSRDMKETKHS